MEQATPTAPETSAPQTNQLTQMNSSTTETKPAKNERMFDVVLPDGKKEQWTESRILERAQKSIGLEKRVSDADKYEKAFNSFVAKVQDPGQLLELLSHPDLKFDETKQEALISSMLGSGKPRIIEAVKRWLYENEVKPSMMDPKDRELMEARSEADKLRQEKLEREKALKDAEDQKNTDAIKEAYRVKMGEAFQKTGLPVEDYLVRQVMEKARLYVRAGKHPDFEHCCQLVQQDFLGQAKAILGKTEVNHILNLLDGETAQKINKALLQAIDKKEDAPEITEPKPRKKDEKSPKDIKKWLRDLERGRA